MINLKRIILTIMAALLLSSAYAQAETITGVLSRDLPYQSDYADNPVIQGESATTGLPFDDVYVPILIVYDNAEDARPLVGLAQADIVIQMPNAGAGATKLLALFADHIPLQAGSVRSARVSFIELREIWDAALVYNGGPGSEVRDEVDITRCLRKYDLYKKGLSFNLISTQQEYVTTVAGKPNAYNTMADLQSIRDTLLTAGQQFTQKPFRFTDDLPVSGIPTTEIEIAHITNATATKQGHPASWANFTYDAERNAYARMVNTGVFSDYSNPDTALAYNNLIVLRTKYRYVGNYVLLPEFAGRGAADIFIGGRYIAGGWVHQTLDSRIVFVDENGEELALQRGTTFIVVANENTRVTYSAGE